MKHKVCKVCCTTSTPQWRKDLSDGFYFCNACGIKFFAKRRKENKRKLKVVVVDSFIPEHILLPRSIHKSLEDSEEAFQFLKNLIK